MNGERARQVALEDHLDRIPLIAPRQAPPSRLGYVFEWLAGHWQQALGLGWPVVFLAAAALEPAADDPEAAGPLLIELASLGFMVLLVGVAAAGFNRDVRVAPLAVATGLVALAFTVSCPLSGHHAGFGTWWYGQMAMVTAMTAFSLAAWRRSRA